MKIFSEHFFRFRGLVIEKKKMLDEIVRVCIFILVIICVMLGLFLYCSYIFCFVILSFSFFLCSL